MTMFSPEGLLSSGYHGGFKDMMSRIKKDGKEFSNGESCLNYDQAAKIDGNDVKADDHHQDAGWLQLGIGRTTENSQGRKDVGSNDDHLDDRMAKSKGRLLELNLFSGRAELTSVSQAPPPQKTTNSCFGSSLLHQNSSSSPLCSLSLSTSWMQFLGRYNFQRPFHNSQVARIDNNNNNDSNGCMDVAAGPSSEFRVIDRPRRPHSCIWFVLQASQNQAKEPFLPQVTRCYLRIKDGRMTIQLLMKYLVRKLRLDSESEMEIKCRGQVVQPFMTMQHVRDTVWSPQGASSSVTLLPNSTSDHVMILHYGRI